MLQLGGKSDYAGLNKLWYVTLQQGIFYREFKSNFDNA